ncbi:MAG: FimV/HubP family polar landmark protein [Woeseiaceae bacterium]|nr:FimV/HubP family polar landmark protein [Woeseiaceae bacterium]
MSRRLSRISLVLVLILSGEVWALGLGDITMNSALNEPLNARIELLSATPEELDNLTIAMASADTFERYGIDRPFYLSDMQFSIVRSGRADGNYVQVRSVSPMAEPFLTFLVEASWSRGRLLREYTVFLDPPTFAPPVADTAPAVQAPTRAAPSDSGRIDRTPPPAATPRPTPRPAPAPRAAETQPQPETAPPPQAQPAPVVDDTPFSTATGADMVVERGDTLWGVASRVRPDSRLTMNQTMLAIFEANPEAFGGNINILRAGAALRIPSADEIFQINRADALQEARRQHAAWDGGTAPVVADTSTRPSLTLVPPDEDIGETADTFVPEPEPEPEPLVDAETLREQEILDRITELESADVPQQQSLIEIRDNELAQLREELARIRGEVYEPVPEDPFVDELDPDAVEEVGLDEMAEDAGDMAEDAVADDVTADEAAESDVIRTPPRVAEPSLVDRIIEFATGIYGIIAAAVILVVGALVWFMRRGGGDDDIEDWQPIDKDELADGAMEATESLAAPTGEESFVVVEQEPASPLDETIDAEAPPITAEPTEEMPIAAPDLGESTDDAAQLTSLEDTFSSETAINLDQSDPIAEADFHMAYGLYDQAADLVNGALQIEPERADLLTKLCEIYFVWGNRDAFIDAAGRLKGVVGDGDSADWDKIVIMGQQIAADDELFAGASAAGATKAVDLAFDEGGDDTGALDMDFGAEGDEPADVLDIGAVDNEETVPVDADGGIDFTLDTTGEAEVTPVDEMDETAESPTVEAVDFDITKEIPSVDETAEIAADDTAEISATAETREAALDETAESPTVDASLSDETTSGPTIEEQFDVLSGTAELPSLDDTIGDAIEASGQSADATAEINLDELDLEIDSMAETELASLDDLDSTGKMEQLVDTSIEEAVEDPGAVTGKNLELDPDATGVQEALDAGEDTGVNEALSDTGLHAPDESLLDATGVTQVLSADLAVETTTDAEGDAQAEEDATMLATTLGTEPLEDSLPDDAETLLASLDDDATGAGDFDFAKTEALPKDAFTGEMNMDETGEMPAVASTDVELDLDDLTAALEISDSGDTVEQQRDDATVEQPRPAPADFDAAGTVSLGADDMSDELSEARTMTEVGTKLDLARAYVDMGDPAGARSILEEVLDEGDEGQRQQAQQLLDSLPS